LKIGHGATESARSRTAGRERIRHR